MRPGPRTAADSDHAQVAVPAPIACAGFLVLALILHSVLPLPTPLPALVRGLGVGCVVGGLFLGTLALAQLKRAHTPVSPHRPSTALVTDGPYRFTRNPIYLGFNLVFVGFTFLAGTLWGIVLLPLAVLAVNRLTIGAEETYLQSGFGDLYTRYRSRVRRWL